MQILRKSKLTLELTEAASSETAPSIEEIFTKRENIRRTVCRNENFSISCYNFVRQSGF